jgi:long-chain acyl-CoA synthetase
MEKPWVKFYDPHVPEHIEYPKILLQQILDDAADHFPRKTAVFFFGGRVNYGELRAQANQFASALKGIGFQKGDRLGLLLANMPQTIISAFGALKAGGVAVFFDPLGDEEELERQFNDGGVETLVVLDLILRRVDKIFPRTKLKQFIITGVKDYLPFPRDFLFSLAARGRGMTVKVARKPNIHLFEDFLSGNPSVLPASEGMSNNPEEDAFILYTSGTSGPPKGVLLRHKNLVANLLQAATWIGEMERGKEIFLSILPFHRAFGMTLAMNLPTYLAAMSVSLPRFEIGQVLSAVRKHRPSFFPALPSMVDSLARDPDISKYKFSSIKFSWSMGKSLPEEILHTFERRMGGKVSESYGLSEATALTHANPIYGKRKIGSIGIPLPDTDAKIVDAGSGEKEMPPGESGELVIRGPQVMKGYWNRPEETQRALRQGWLHTGDMARMDEDGFFYITGKVIKSQK